VHPFDCHDESGPLEGLRGEVRLWLATNVPQRWREQLHGRDPEKHVDFQRGWFAKLVAAGYAAPHWPARYGGGGHGLAGQVVIAEEFARADAPRAELAFVGLYHTAAALMEFGTEEQRQVHLPRILDGEIWCQGFSEPNAGSDLAAVQTHAVRDDRGGWRISGQKLWSSMAMHAHWSLVLARTDRDAPQRRGLSLFLVSLTSDGVDVRPIRQMNGTAEFCEVFFDDVHVQDSGLVGQPGDGWKVAQTMLSAERGLTLVDLVERLRVDLTVLGQSIAAHESRERDGRPDVPVRREFAALYEDVSILRLLIHRMLRELVEDGGARPQASIVKLYYSEVLRRVADLGLRVRDLDAYAALPPSAVVHTARGDWLRDYLSSWTWTIGGGTSEIQRNVIAERVLDLPREGVGT
jgi:alkylation response protein AidB-like acyl-CoA dehydrogenase